MTVTYVGGTGATPAAGTSSVTPSVSGFTPQPGDIAIIACVSKPNTTGLGVPTNWTQLLAQSVGTGTTGAGTGPVRLTLFMREVPDTGWSIPSVANSGSTATTVAGIYFWRKDADETWSIAASNATYNSRTTASTTWSGTGAVNINAGAGDELLVLMGMTTTTPTVGTTTITAPGATVGTDTERTDGGSTTNNDAKMAVLTAPITAGAETSAPTISSTLSSSTGATGGTAWLRIRALPPAEIIVTGAIATSTSTAIAGDVSVVTPPPTSLATAFDYRADNATANYATVTTTGGIADVSGTGQLNIVPATAATRPALVAGGANGHSLTVLDGVDDRLGYRSGLYSVFGVSRAGITISTVARFDPATVLTANRYVMQFSVSAASQSRIGILVNAAGNWVGEARRLNAETVSQVIGPVADSELHYLMVVADYVGQLLTLYVDGVAYSATPNWASGNSDTTAASTAGWGSHGTPGGWFQGEVYEQAGWTSALTIPESANEWAVRQDRYTLTAPTPSISPAGRDSALVVGQLTIAPSGNVSVVPTSRASTSVIGVPTIVATGNVNVAPNTRAAAKVLTSPTVAPSGNAPTIPNTRASTAVVTSPDLTAVGDVSISPASRVSGLTIVAPTLDFTGAAPVSPATRASALQIGAIALSGIGTVSLSPNTRASALQLTTITVAASGTVSVVPLTRGSTLVVGTPSVTGSGLPIVAPNTRDVARVVGNPSIAGVGNAATTPLSRTSGLQIGTFILTPTAVTIAPLSRVSKLQTTSVILSPSGNVAIVPTTRSSQKIAGTVTLEISTGPTLQYWDGTTLHDVTVSGVWDGQIVHPLTSVERA